MNFGKEGIPTPRYLLRRRLILSLLHHYKAGRFLEIGCGRGELLPWLAQLGFEGIGLEISPEVLPLARQAVRPYASQIRVVDETHTFQHERFQYVFAFEVLEHLPDDATALLRWREWLAPDGRFILSVPAHMSKWTPTDDIVGHCRRYEREDLQRLLTASGYHVETFWSYGFPLTLLTSRLRTVFHRSRLRRVQDVSRQERTLHSSLESRWGLGPGTWLLGLLAEGLGFGFHLGQLPFRHLDLGDGYLVACRLA